MRGGSGLFFKFFIERMADNWRKEYEKGKMWLSQDGFWWEDKIRPEMGFQDERKLE